MQLRITYVGKGFHAAGAAIHPWIFINVIPWIVTGADGVVSLYPCNHSILAGFSQLKLQYNDTM
jgi:hypothetical protein